MDAAFLKETVDSYLNTINKNEDTTVEISFFGGTFTAVEKCVRKELLKAASVYKKDGRVDHIRCSTRPDYIDEEILEEAKYYGMDVIELGIQSLDDEVLKASGRGHRAEDAFRASKLIKEYGITLGHQIMPGLPLDTFSKDIETANKSIMMKPDIVRIYPTLVIKDTPLEEMYLNGEYIPYTLDEAVTISGELLTMYELAGIKVIRCGLQATEEMKEGSSIVSGPWHPAFSELVRGKRVIDVVNKYLNFLYPQYKGNLWLAVNPKDISLLYADGKRYFNEIKDKIGCVVQDKNLSRGKLEIRRGSNLPSIEICI